MLPLTVSIGNSRIKSRVVLSGGERMPVPVSAVCAIVYVL